MKHVGRGVFDWIGATCSGTWKVSCRAAIATSPCCDKSVLCTCDKWVVVSREWTFKLHDRQLDGKYHRNMDYKICDRIHTATWRENTIRWIISAENRLFVIIVIELFT